MNNRTFFIALLLWLGLQVETHAFVLLGPVLPEENTLTFAGSTPVTSSNMRDDLGGPKQLDEFYRWNTPHLVYGFDQSFVMFFGQEGINAVDDAMRAINDYFIPEDGSYAGVSSLNLAKHGFGGNFNTAWLNATAANENLIDIKTLTLGMMVNYLGLGNPYRFAFTATNSLVPNLNVSGAIFSVVLKNFDPITLAKSDVINGVQYSYRLIHDQPPGSQANAAVVGGMTLDMEEFTSDSSGNAYSAVSAIVDAFYGNTDLIWTDVPSLFNFGVYYDGMNAMGGMYQPRHALTHDDAGGLKYLYNTNTIAMEYNPYTLISAADYTVPVWQYGLPPSGSEIVNRAAGVFPTRNTAGLPTIFASSHPLNSFNNPVGLGGAMSGGTGFYGGAAGKMDWAFRGGIDTIQFHRASFDSLLLMNHYSTNYIWTDTFMTNAQIKAQVPSTVLNTTPGASIAMTDGRSHYFSQILSRDVPAPDFVFYATGLGAVNGTPVAFTRTRWADQAAPAPGVTAAGATRINASIHNILQEIPVGASGPGTLASGPGAPTLAFPHGESFQIQFNSAYAVGGFEVVWNGEVSLVGDMAVPTTSQQWAYIKGPGPADLFRFPDSAFANTLIQNTIVPVEGVPIITLVSDNGGQTPIAPNSFERTIEDLTILGKNFRDATALEIIDNNEALIHLIYPVTDYIINDGMIVIPNGVIGYDAEGVNRRIRIWNTLGQSAPSEEQFSVITGPPVITATTYDGLPFDRAEPLTLTGAGFKSRQINLGSATVNYKDGNATLTNIIIETAGGDNLDGNATGLGRDLQGSLTILSDTRAILTGDALGAWADGAGRILRVSRGTTRTVSAPSPTVFQLISTQPTVNRVTWVNLADSNQTDINSTSALRRDEAIWITGVGLNATTAVELVRENGGSYNPPITAFFAAGDMDDNGSRLRLARHAFSSSDVDGFGAVRSRLKLTNLFGSTMYVASDGADSAFNVNIQPNDGSTAANEIVLITGMPPGFDFNVTANLWNRSVTTGDDLTFIGAGLRAVKKIAIEHANGTLLSPEPTLILEAYGAPGVTMGDALIRIDTSVAQFTDINAADATSRTHYMRFRLESDRNTVWTSAGMNQRFLAGTPPSYQTLTGLTIGSLHYRRDNDVMNFVGDNLQIITRFELVDKNGLPIPGSTSVSDLTGVEVLSKSRIRIPTDSFDMRTRADSVNMNRRVKIYTLFGSATSNDDANGTFSVSADPVITGFGGTGWNGVNTRYSAKDGTFIMYGQNLRGLKRIFFEDSLSGIYLDIPFDPAAPPAGITIDELGMAITFSSDYLMNTTPTWLRSGGQRDRKVRVVNATNQEANSTFTETRDGFGNLTLNNAQPRITMHPQAVTINEASPFTLSVTASNATAYQWRKDGAAIAGATAATYNVANAALTDAGTYSVAVYGQNVGEVVYSAYVSVAINATGTPPVITAHPVDINATEGSSVTFSVAATGSLPFTYQWEKNAANLLGETNSTLVLSNLAAGNAGAYRVVVFNAYGSATSNAANLGVLGPGTKKWEFTSGGNIISDPAIGSDGTVYFGSDDNKLYALNPNGSKKWEFLSGGRVRGSPTLGSDGTVYLGSEDRKLYALDSSGSKKWEFLTGDSINGSPAIGVDETVYFGSQDFKLYALDSNGSKKWEFATGSRVWTSPVIGYDGTIYFGSYDSKLYALDSNGSKKWEFVAGNRIHGSPALGNDGTIYFTSEDNKVYALNPDGTKKWEYATGDMVAGPVAIGADGSLYVGSNDNKVYALNPDGTKKWEFLTGDDVRGSPSIGADGTIYIGSFDFKLYALNPDGTKKWEFSTGEQVHSCPAIAFDGTIYFGSYDDKLYALASSSMGLANSSWPKFQQNNKNTGRSRLAQGLIAYYPFNGNANDESGSGYHAAVNGATLTADRNGTVGKAYAFDGTDDWIDVTAHNMPLSGAVSRTVSFWMKDELPLTNVVNPIQFGTVTYSGAAFGFNRNPSGQLGFWAHSHAGDANPNGWHINPGIATDGRWHLYTATYDGSTAKYYTDGALKGTKAMSLNTSDGRLVMGRSRGENNYLKGAIDEVRVYNRVLKDGEVSELHLTERPSFESGMVAYYPFDGNATDMTGNGFDLSAFGGVALSTDRHGDSNRAYVFDGTADYFKRTATNLPDMNASTVSAWVNFTGNTRGTLFFDGWSAGPHNDTLFMLDDIQAGIRADRNQAGLFFDPVGALNVTIPSIKNRWALVTWVMYPAKSEVYVDGVLAQTINQVGSRTGYHSPLMIGGWNQSGTLKHPFTGKLDEIRIYNRALRASEINQLYNAHKPAPSGVSPTITSHPADVNGTVGSNATFTFTATGTAPLTYQWQKNGVDLNGSTATTLNLTNVQLADFNSTYRAVVTNAYGSATSNAAALGGLGPGSRIWELATGGMVLSSPAIGTDGTVYVGTGNNVYAVNPNGTVKWQYNTGAHVDASAAIGPDGTVYIGSNSKKIYALDGQTGALKWDIWGGMEVKGTPAIGADGTIYAPAGGALFALDVNGTKKWQANAAGGNYPAISADGTVYISSGKALLAIDGKTGAEKWRHTTTDTVYGGAAIGADGTVYYGSGDKSFHALNGQTGEVKWSFNDNRPIYCCPSIGSDGSVYFSTASAYQSNKVYSLDGQTGAKKWEFALGPAANIATHINSSPAVGADGTVYVGSYIDGKLYALDGATGAKKWEYAVGDQINSSPAIASNGTIYFGSRDFKLYALATSSLGLANSPWPKFHQNNKNTGTGLVLAGNGVAGFGGDGGLATSAQMNLPHGVAYDPLGNLYIADTFNHRIRKVDTSGVITTVAGSGAAGYSGDGAAATAANLKLPADVALSGSTLYIADTYNHRIRSVNLNTGVISTVAGDGTEGFGGDGGAATSAKLKLPYGVAVSGGSVYIADTFNHRIRKVDFNGTGNISTYAGNGTEGFSGDGGGATAAQLKLPHGVAISGASVYIADTYNHRIRRVSGANISTVAGDGTEGFGGDGGLATSAQLKLPQTVTVDGAGNVYIADTYNHCIRKVSGANIGTAAALLKLPKGVAVKVDGSVIAIGDTYNHRIRKVE